MRKFHLLKKFIAYYGYAPAVYCATELAYFTMTVLHLVHNWELISRLGLITKTAFTEMGDMGVPCYTYFYSICLLHIKW